MLIVLLILSCIIGGIKVITDISQSTPEVFFGSAQVAVSIEPVVLEVEGLVPREFIQDVKLYKEAVLETEEILTEVKESPTLILSSLPTFDIIIQAGQSNSVGSGVGEIEKSYQPTDDVWYMTTDFEFLVAEERKTDDGNLVGDFSLTFAEDYISNGLLEDGRKLLILRTSVGGTGFFNGRWGLEDDLYLQMLGMTSAVLNSNPDNRLIAILWSQGEADVVNPLMDGDIHYSNLYALVNNVRLIFNEPNLPFIACDFAEPWKEEKGAELVDPILNAIKKVCNDVGSAAFISSDGLKVNAEILNNEDIVHFSRESLYILGHKFFDSFKLIRDSL